MIRKIFTEHPAQVGETYGQHFRHASGFALEMFRGAFACTLHCLIPALCVRTGSTIVRRLNDQMNRNRALLSQSEDKA